MSEKELTELKEFIEVNKTRLSSLFVCSPRPEISWSRINKFLHHCYIYLFIEKCNHDHFNKFRHAITLLRRIRTKRLLGRLYSKPDLNDKFIYFPFHAVDDFQLTVRERHCLDQFYLLNLFADSIPPGYKLYVKEHPDSIGVMPYKMLKKVASREEIVIVPPTISSQTLVKHAKAVITINSTVGFESLLLSKPVIVLGWPYYRGFGVTIDVDSFRDFPKVIKKALNFKVDKEKLYRFLYTVRNSCFEGRPCVFEEDLSNDNIEKVTKSVLIKMNKMGLIKDNYIRKMNKH